MTLRMTLSMTLGPATSALLLAALLPLSGCGGGGGGGGGTSEPAGGKVLRPAAVQRCLKKQRLLVTPHATQSGIDFTAYWRNGRNQADFGVERAPGAAAAREEAWKKLAAQAQIKNVDAYYARYGNVVVGYERVPSTADRQRLERCLT
jgi:hypothetical protein